MDAVYGRGSFLGSRGGSLFGISGTNGGAAIFSCCSASLNRSGFDAASFFEKDGDYCQALPGRAA
ncbi:MAG: hypothetical protein QOE52_400 [Mycobacterium sp.]|nr:hypothetical protein [Mycobacterium sp.]